MLLCKVDFWRRWNTIVEFSIRQLHLIIESDPLQVCRFSRLVLFGEWKILFTTRQVEFRFVRFDEWKILCSIWHIVFSIRKLHLISDKDPLQACRFGRFVLFGEWKILFTTRQVEFRFVRFDEWKILCSMWHIVFSIRKLHLISNNDPLQVCRFGRFVRFSERINLFTTWQIEFPSDNCILL